MDENILKLHLHRAIAYHELVELELVEMANLMNIKLGPKERRKTNYAE